MKDDQEKFSDETLTAFLDGELDVAQAQEIDAALSVDDVLGNRLAGLDVSVTALRQAMDPGVLGAPGLPAAFLKAPKRSYLERFGAPLALVASFALGIGLMSFVQSRTQETDWLNAIASYQALYVTETLSAAHQTPQDTDKVLRRAGETFGVTLTPATQIAGLEFRRAQVLGFKGETLLQMAYLTPEGTPVALCIVHLDDADRGPEETVMFDLAGVSWIQDGVGYFLIGGTDANLIDSFATDILTSI
ncbi:MAG: hypothetical protein ABJL67_19365 [Sulfitobacter sp.]